MEKIEKTSLCHFELLTFNLYNKCYIYFPFFSFQGVFVSYGITVITGDKRNSGTNANVSYALS